MFNCGIIAEYDPFHNGHEYLIEQAKKQGATHITVVMSGQFVQRGSVSVCPAAARTRMALKCGADLVLELPVTFSTATAQRFAYGGIGILDALGCVDAVSFGSECADIQQLRSICDGLDDRRINERLHFYLDSGMTFAAARQKALDEIGYNGSILRNPNDILAVNYLDAIKRAGVEFDVFPVKRTGAMHGEQAVGCIASSSYIRELIAQGKDISPYMPKEAVQILSSSPISDQSRLDGVTLARLRSMSVGEISRLPDVGEGLENKIYRAVRESTSTDGAIAAVKSKRYTYARIKRIFTAALLGIDSHSYRLPLQFIRVLGMNERGKEILSAAKAKLPVITRAKDADSLDESAKRVMEVEQRANDMFAIAAGIPCEPLINTVII